MSIEEHGILHNQIKAARGRLAEKGGLDASLTWRIGYHGERIAVFLLAPGAIARVVIRATSKSALPLYGSLVPAILSMILWGVASRRAHRLLTPPSSAAGRVLRAARCCSRADPPRPAYA